MHATTLPTLPGSTSDDLPALATDGTPPFQLPAEHLRLGRYMVLGTLGRGGMGTVLEAFDRTLDRRVAVKVLHGDLDERHTVRLTREAQAMAKQAWLAEHPLR
jgi:hypothetical protein